MIRSIGSDRVITGQGDVVWAPRNLTRKYAIVYSPPGNELASWSARPDIDPAMFKFLSALADCGALVVVCDWDQHAWGNATVRGHIETLRTTKLASIVASLGLGNSGLLDTSKIVLLGFSQGAVDCFGYAMDNPTHVQAIGIFAGVTDLIGFYSGTYRWGGDAGTLNQADIGTAWGITYPTSLPANADPYNNASSVTCPVLIGHSAGDTTIPSASAIAMAAALPSGTALQISTSTAHSDAEAQDALNIGIAAWLLAKAT